ncbi:MAG: hypothetical protein WDA20_08325, partial [Desulfuromonadales bacterium]
MATSLSGNLSKVCGMRQKIFSLAGTGRRSLNFNFSGITLSIRMSENQPDPSFSRPQVCYLNLLDSENLPTDNRLVRKNEDAIPPFGFIDL